MSIQFSSYPVHLQDEMKMDRNYWKSQDIPKEKETAFHKDALKNSELSRNRDIVLDRCTHTVVQSATAFGDARSEILKEIREAKGHYDYSDVVNACGLSYAKLYSEIEKHYENEQEPYYAVNGMRLTKEKEMEWLDTQYEQEVAWQISCAKVAAQEQVFLGNIPAVPTKELEELEDCFYKAKETYMKLYQKCRQTGEPLALHNYLFGDRQMYAALNTLGNL